MVCLKKSLLLTVLLAGFLAMNSQAQDGAASIFERAKAAHGGAALENLNSYRDTGTITYFNQGQIVAKLE